MEVPVRTGDWFRVSGVQKNICVVDFWLTQPVCVLEAWAGLWLKSL